jgi:hypothetical protein
LYGCKQINACLYMGQSPLWLQTMSGCLYMWNRIAARTYSTCMPRMHVTLCIRPKALWLQCLLRNSRTHTKSRRVLVLFLTLSQFMDQVQGAHALVLRFSKCALPQVSSLCLSSVASSILDFNFCDFLDFLCRSVSKLGSCSLNMEKLLAKVRVDVL